MSDKERPLTTTRRPSSSGWAQRLRYAFYSLIVCVAFFGTINVFVELLEDSEVLDTVRPDDSVQFVDKALFEERGDGSLQTTYYAESKFTRSRFFKRKPKGGWRAFVLGGSFMFGIPYSQPANHPAGGSDAGSIPFWLREALRARHPEQDVEVINLACTGQDSTRVRIIAEEVLDYEPDVLLVASCNNEGAVAPSDVRRRLHKLGGYRLLRNLLIRAPEDGERPASMPQDPDVQKIRATFRANLDAIAQAAGDRGIPVLLATVSANYRYDQLEFLPGLPGMLPEGLQQDFCVVKGYGAAHRRDFERAERILRACPQIPLVAQWLALWDMKHGRAVAEPNPLAARWGECVTEGVEAFYRQEHEAAIELLMRCDNVPEALRWIGLSQYELGRYDEALATLEQSVELYPRVRCRPSLRRIIEEVAAKYEHVHLVEIDAEAKRLAPHGIPGEELFVDNNHMNWAGLSRMADLYLDELVRLDLQPTGAPTDRRLDRVALAAERGLPELVGAVTP